MRCVEQEWECDCAMVGLDDESRLMVDDDEEQQMAKAVLDAAECDEQ